MPSSPEEVRMKQEKVAENISYSLATIFLSPAPGFSNDQPTERCFLKVTLNLGNKPLVAAEQVSAQPSSCYWPEMDSLVAV